MLVHNGIIKVPKSKTKISKENLLSGVWISADEAGSDVEYTVTSTGVTFKVEAIDRYDDEAADVFEIEWDGEVLSFATHWNSTGRFSRCRLQALSKNRVSFTYTYTDNEILLRKLKR